MLQTLEQGDQKLVGNPPDEIYTSSFGRSCIVLQICSFADLYVCTLGRADVMSCDSRAAASPSQTMGDTIRHVSITVLFLTYIYPYISPHTLGFKGASLQVLVLLSQRWSEDFYCNVILIGKKTDGVAGRIGRALSIGAAMTIAGAMTGATFPAVLVRT